MGDIDELGRSPFIPPGQDLVEGPRQRAFSSMDAAQLVHRWASPTGQRIRQAWIDSGFDREKLVSLVGRHHGHLDIRGINLSGQVLDGIDLSFTDLFRANLQKASMKKADLRDCWLSETSIKGTLFDWAKMDGALLDGVDYDHRTSFIGVDLSVINFTLAALLQDLARSQQRIAHLEKRSPLFAWILRVTTNYGRSLFRWLLWCLGIVLCFGLAYGIAPNITTGHGLADGLYFSVVTFTTLGYGDIAPVGFGKILAILEVCTGYGMGGLLIAIMARRVIGD